jgi:hypothetical protein
MKSSNDIDVTKLIKKTLIPHVEYLVTSAEPATGMIYVINNFISGHVRMRGRPNGSYPYRYLEMIDELFGKANITLEVCSGTVKADVHTETVDLHMGPNDEQPSMVCDATNLFMVSDERFDRWRADPPYNQNRAQKMYGCDMPSLPKLLKEGARVVSQGSLLFLLCSQNYQICPKSLKRIALIYISVVPSNETRALNVYYKR